MERGEVVKLLSALAMTAIIGSTANAAVTPLPGGVNNAYVGTNMSVYADANLGSALNGGGGAFNGFVNPPGAPPQVNTAFWCIDDQTYFWFSETGNANITLLRDLPAANGASPDTYWFQDVTDWSMTMAPAWNNGWGGNPNGSQSISTDARDRMRMAAYLVQQYNGFYPGMNGSSTFNPSPGPPAPPSSNNDIQNAIWDITNNATFATHNPGTGHSINSGSPTAGEAYWINEALAHYQSVSNNTWAVLSWNAGSNGYVDPASANGTARQTFLVFFDSPANSLTPEPGLYGSLALGMSGLAFMVNRRRKNKA
jgi:hypothetical protein